MLGGRRPTFKGGVSGWFLVPLGLVAGTMDAIGGGGWGPVGTTTLLSTGRIEPRKVVGSIDASEFIVAVMGSLGFLLALGSQGINFGYALALLAGGVLAAPLAAWLVRHMAPRLLGVGRRRDDHRDQRPDDPASRSACPATRSLAIMLARCIVAWVALVAWTIRAERGRRGSAARDGEGRRRTLAA